VELFVVSLAIVAGLCFARFAVRPMIDQLNDQQRVIRRRQIGMDFGADSAKKSQASNDQGASAH
jgi:hypothetical protein